MVRSQNITDKQAYIRELYCKEEIDFTHVFQTAEDKQSIQLSPEEGKLLSMLLSIHKAKYVLEIGTLVGYSCCWIATAIPEDGKVITIEVDKVRFEIAKQNFAKTKFNHKITAVNADAIDYLKNLNIDHELDAVFIDGKKEDYCTHLELVYPLLRKDGLIIADNTFLFDTVYNNTPSQYNTKRWKAMRKFNLEMSNIQKYKSLIFPTDEGLSVAIKRMYSKTNYLR